MPAHSQVKVPPTWSRAQGVPLRGCLRRGKAWGADFPTRPSRWPGAPENPSPCHSKEAEGVLGKVSITVREKTASSYMNRNHYK